MFKTTQSPFAREVIERLQAVYAIEAEIRGSSAEQRLAVRRARTAPLMEAIKARLTTMVGQLFSQSKLAEAINYVLNHWDGLTLFLRDGRVEVEIELLDARVVVDDVVRLEQVGALAVVSTPEHAEPVVELLADPAP
ncbi:IS66 family transposase [Bradyrhizobium elkanii]